MDRGTIVSGYAGAPMCFAIRNSKDHDAVRGASLSGVFNAPTTAVPSPFISARSPRSATRRGSIEQFCLSKTLPPDHIKQLCDPIPERDYGG